MKNATVLVLSALAMVSAFLVLSPVPSSAVGPGETSPGRAAEPDRFFFQARSMRRRATSAMTAIRGCSA